MIDRWMDRRYFNLTSSTILIYILYHVCNVYTYHHIYKNIIYLTLPGMKMVSSRKKMGEVTSTHKYAPMYQKVIRRMSEN
jgi:hypothetical protein